MKLLAMGCMFFAVAFGCVWAAMLRKQAVWMSWPQASGIIVTSGPELRHATPSGKRLLRPQWEFRVNYRYSVAGREYEGRNLSNEWLTAPASDSRDVPERMRELQGQYGPGATVAVYYDPAAPHRSFLIPRRVSGLWFLAAVSVLFAGSGVLLFIRSVQE